MTGNGRWTDDMVKFEPRNRVEKRDNRPKVNVSNHSLFSEKCECDFQPMMKMLRN